MSVLLNLKRILLLGNANNLRIYSKDYWQLPKSISKAVTFHKGLKNYYDVNINYLRNNFDLFVRTISECIMISESNFYDTFPLVLHHFRLCYRYKLS